MAFRNLFVKDDESKVKQESNGNKINKFPSSFEVATPATSNNLFPSTPNTNVFQSVDSEHVDTFVQMYEDGFNNLNQNGYDFYEFFQAIISSNAIDNPQMYIMAMNMGAGLDKTVTKNKLTSQADYYLNEIDKIYNHYLTTGTSKKQDLITQKESETQSLTSDLSNLKSQQEAIANQIRTKEDQLSSIGNKYQPLINEVDGKLKANEVAKNNIVTNITKVKNGINNNIK